MTLFNQMVDKARNTGVRSFSTDRLNTRRTAMAADMLSRAFSALSDPTRRDLVARLAVGDATVGELAAPYDVTVQAVSKHLRVLEDAGLVSRSRDAQRRPVHLEAEVLDLMTAWIERYRRTAEERYRRLDDVLATLPADVDPLPPATRTGPALPSPARRSSPRRKESS
jgi:DNA-binding transcriptional ArsR family regulator